MKRQLVLALSVAALVAATTRPASAQVADFFCSTFSIGCEPPPPPPPPPAPAPVAEAPAPKKHVRRAHKKVAKKAAEAPAAPAEAAPAAPKAQ